MRPLKSLLSALGVEPRKAELERIAAMGGVSPSLVKYWHERFLVPPDPQFRAICAALRVNPLVIKLRMGLIDEGVRRLLMERAETFVEAVEPDVAPAPSKTAPRSVLTTEYGTLYQGDCLSLMKGLPAGAFQLIFADPPFNLDKAYPSKIDDALKDEDYLLWSFTWIDECVRLLAEGGSFFLYNLPKWNTALAEFLNRRLTFRDWITIDIKFSLPIAGRLYPSHYSLLYYTKGERPAAFKPDRLPMEICPHCLRDLVDYGGYKDKMNALGVNLTDVWNDIPPVRHRRYKKRQGANELSIKLLDRVIQMASREGDSVFDPFGGSGSTYVVAELKKRRWTGIEIGPVDEIVDRLKHLAAEAEHLAKLRSDYNCLFTPGHKLKREKIGLWTNDTVRSYPLPTPADPQGVLALCDKARRAS